MRFKCTQNQVGCTSSSIIERQEHPYITYNLPYNNNVHTAWNSIWNSMIQGISNSPTILCNSLLPSFLLIFKNLGCFKEGIQWHINMQNIIIEWQYLFTAKKGKVRLYANQCYWSSKYRSKWLPSDFRKNLEDVKWNWISSWCLCVISWV